MFTHVGTIGLVVVHFVLRLRTHTDTRARIFSSTCTHTLTFLTNCWYLAGFSNGEFGMDRADDVCRGFWRGRCDKVEHKHAREKRE